MSQNSISFAAFVSNSMMKIFVRNTLLNYIGHSTIQDSTIEVALLKLHYAGAVLYFNITL